MSSLSKGETGPTGPKVDSSIQVSCSSLHKILLLSDDSKL